MTPALRRLAAAALLTLCAAPAARPQATNLPARVNTTFGLTTNGVVKVPYGRVDWITQTNFFARATVTNLTAVTAGITGNSTIGGTLGVTGASTLASAGITGNATIGGTLGVTGTITGPGSGITGVLAANIPIVDAGGLITATNVETAFAEIAAGLDAVDTSTYLTKTGTNTVDNGWRLNVFGTAGAQALLLTATEDTPILTLTNGVHGVELSIAPATGDLLRNGFTVYDEDNFDLGTVTGDLADEAFGQVAIQWSSRDFVLVEGSTNLVGWTQYTNESGSRRLSIDAIQTAVTTDQSATLRSAVRRVPRGFTSFHSIRVTWVSSDSGGDNELRGITVSGWSDITGSETVLHTDSVTRDVTAAGTPTVTSIAALDFSEGANPTPPQWISIDVRFSVEDGLTGDKTGILLVEALSQ